MRPSFETPCCARLLRTRSVGVAFPVQYDWFHGIDPLAHHSPTSARTSGWGAAHPTIKQSNRLIVLPDLRMRAQHRIHRLDHVAHARLRARAFHHHHHLQLLAQPPPPTPRAPLAPPPPPLAP